MWENICIVSLSLRKQIGKTAHTMRSMLDDTLSTSKWNCEWLNAYRRVLMILANGKLRRRIARDAVNGALQLSWLEKFQTIHNTYGKDSHRKCGFTLKWCAQNTHRHKVCITTMVFFAYIACFAGVRGGWGSRSRSRVKAMEKHFLWLRFAIVSFSSV